MPLTDHGTRWVCADRHSYDLSREGYLNLLPVTSKPSRDPGDTRVMIAARRQVLDSGLFEPVATALAREVTERIATEHAAAGRVVLDAGCGDGYYTDTLRSTLIRATPMQQSIVIGTDISKWAIVAAARRYRHVTWAVANNRTLPILQGRADLITSLFGFETWQSWAALQKPGQQVMVVHAGPLHLIELRKLVYETVRIHGRADDNAALKAGYHRIDERALSFSVPGGSSEHLSSLLAMTPHAHRVSGDRQDSLPMRLECLSGQPLTLDISVRWYQRG